MLAQSLGLDVLIEVHDADELATALAQRPGLIGINNRNLKTFETDLNTTIDLLKDIPPKVVVVTESGISNTDDINRMQSHDVHCFLSARHLCGRLTQGMHWQSCLASTLSTGSVHNHGFAAHRN